MISVIETISGQRFQSIKLASEYFKLPQNIIKKGLDTNATIVVGSSKYHFNKLYSVMSKSVGDSGPVRRFPFGKYSGQRISKSKDLEYLEWMLELPNCNPSLRRSLRERIHFLK